MKKCDEFTVRELERRRPADETLAVIDDFRQELLAISKMPWM